MGSCTFQIHLCNLACVMSREFTREAVLKFLPAQFPEFYVNYIHSKLFNLFTYRDILSKIFTAHYACRNADLNLNCTLLIGTTNGFVFQIINSLKKAWFSLAHKPKDIRTHTYATQFLIPALLNQMINTMADRAFWYVRMIGPRPLCLCLCFCWPRFH